MKVERAFTGESKLEDILFSILSTQIDKIILYSYDEGRANAIPSESTTEGMVKK